MIRTQEKVPDYYIEKSRDFQILCRIEDFLLNSVKYNTDSMLNITDTRQAKNTILPLIGDKFGIYDKEAYSNRHLLDALPSALKNKGSLQSVVTLVNAFLDSMDVFDYATIYNSKDEESAKEISGILNRDIRTYSIVIVLSSFPSLTKLRVLDTYIKMVIPTGLIVQYAFGFNAEIIDKFKYREFVLLYYAKQDEQGIPITTKIANKNDKYSATYRPDAVLLTDEREKHFIDKQISDIPVNSVGISNVFKGGSNK